MKMGKKKASESKVIREQMTKAFEIPQEVISDVPLIQLTGNKEISVENFSGLIEYNSERMRLNTKCGVLVIEGAGLEAKSMTADLIVIKGTIKQVGFNL